MIRLVTFQNFPLVDLQIERAYQRRRTEDGAVCRCLMTDKDQELLRALCEMRRHARQERDWLHELAREVQSLSVKRRGRAMGRSPKGYVMAANAPLNGSHQRRRKAS